MGNAIGRDTIYREITDKIIKDFENGIVKAASLASKASDFILQFQLQTIQSETQNQTHPDIVGAAA